MNKHIYIYFLVDPNDKKVRYIGVTKNMILNVESKVTKLKKEEAGFVQPPKVLSKFNRSIKTALDYNPNKKQ